MSTLENVLLVDYYTAVKMDLELYISTYLDHHNIKSKNGK
jgi:hypothetical protein